MPRIRAQAARLAAVALVAAVLPGCAVLRSDPPPPSARVQADGSRLVTVVRGDDLYQLSVRHKVAIRDIVTLNGLPPPYTVKEGQQLRLPATLAAGAGGFAGAPPAAYMPPAASAYSPAPAVPAPTAGYGSPPSYAPPAAASAPARIGGGTVERETLAPLPGAPASRAAAPRSEAAPPDAPAPGRTPRALVPPSRTEPATSPPVAAAAPAAEPRGEAVSALPPPPPAPDPVAPATAPIVPVPPSPARIAAAPEPEPAPAVREFVRRPVGRGGFQWPVEGEVITSFGRSGTGTVNDGINIAARRGAAVAAAQDGVVAYAGNELRGFGNLVLVRHSSGWVTAYGHADRLLVAQGDSVRRGQPIALVGSSGSADRPQLHFEMRRLGRPVDPLRYLPSQVAGR